MAVLVKAGSRHETSANLGVNHALRLAVGLTTGKATSFTAVRSIQQVSYVTYLYVQSSVIMNQERNKIWSSAAWWKSGRFRLA